MIKQPRCTLWLIVCFAVLLHACAQQPASSESMQATPATRAVKKTLLTKSTPPVTMATAVTPTNSAGAHACRAADVASAMESNSATGSIEFYVALTNISAKMCTIQGPPRIQLVDPSNHSLDIAYHVLCFLCNQLDDTVSTVSPATATAYEPTATALAYPMLYGAISLSPRQRVSATLIWDNYCQPLPPGGAHLRITLPNGPEQVDVPGIIVTGARCDDADARSSMMISHFSRMSTP